MYEENSSIYNFILFKFVVETKLLRPGLTVYKQISFFDFFQINRGDRGKFAPFLLNLIWTP